MLRFRSVLAAITLFAIVAPAASQAQENRFNRMVGRWVHLSPEPGNTTPTGHQIIIMPDGAVFTSSNTIKGAAGRCIDSGANFCFEGTDGGDQRFRCAYDVAFLSGDEAMNFRLVRESQVVPCPVGMYHRAQ
jgi:hypothetical protein